MLKIATWNVNSLRVRLPHLLDWLEECKPDVFGLQEIKMIDEQFPLEEIRQSGYQAIFSGQKTYNGVALISKQPAEEIITELPGLDDPQRRVLGAKFGDVYILNLYVPNGSEVDSEKYQYKLDWLNHLQDLVKDLLNMHEQLALMGDFNIAPKDEDVHDPDEWQGKVLVSDAERNHFQQLLDQGLNDCFRLFEQEEKRFSWWDYRAAAFRRNRGMRIDHILASQPLSEHCKQCYIDKAPRKLERPSDHTPVVAEFDL